LETAPDKAVVLVVDDDEDDCLFIRKALEETAADVNLVFLRNGLDLINFLRAGKSRPDLILLDLNMPLMGGKEALIEIESDGDFGNLPVAVLTTSNEETDRHFCIEHGAKGFFTKPHDFRVFSSLVQSLIRQFVTN